MKTGLSVVIPAYNEEKNLPKCLENVYPILKKSDLNWEIVIVNDGSKDNTGQVARLLAKKYPHTRVIENNPNRGYGGALKAGFAAASKEFIVMYHADNQFDFSEVNRLLELQKETDADLVSGTRPSGGHDPLHRLIFRWGWNTLVRALFGYLATDVDCGFKLFKKDLISKVNLPSDGAMIDTQLYAGARARGLKIVETPVQHLPRTEGKSTGGNPRVILKALKELLIFWWQLRQELLVERGLAVFRWEMIILIWIVVLAGFLRLYRIDQYMTFLGDEGRDAIVMRDIVLGRHFPLIGPGTSIGNMYLGPWYYYLTAPALGLANLSPVGPAAMVALIGVATVGLLWWISRQWFGRKVSLIITLLYAASPVVINYSRSSWNPNVMPFFALLSVYGIWKVWRLGYWRWLVITTVSLVFALNSHYLALLLVPLLFIFWFLALVRQKTKRVYAVKATLVAAVAFILLMSPLVFFDLRHNWQNFGALKTFFTDRQTTVNLKAYKALPVIWPNFTLFTTRLLAAGQSSVGLPVSIFMLVAGVYLLAKKPTPEYQLVLVWLVIGLVGLSLYKQHIYDHYFGFLYPAPFLVLGFILRELFKTKLTLIPAAILLAALALVYVQHSPHLFPPNNQLQRTRAVSDFILNESGNEAFNLALISKNNYDASYRYYLLLNSAPYYTIHDRLAEQLFVICETSECQPLGHPLWEIAAFGWAKVDREWVFPWGVKVLRLVHESAT